MTNVGNYDIDANMSSISGDIAADFLRCGGEEEDYTNRMADDEEEDPFEKEMEAEMERRARKAEVDGGLQPPSGRHEDDGDGQVAAGPSAAASSSKGGAAAAQASSSKYDAIYFDSDDDEADAPSARDVVNDDDLLYDPDEDDENQKFVDELRSDARRKRSKGVGDREEAKKAPDSDAVLNCPACFCLLCLDCQRHELYEGQYRAMFVRNCHVVTAERLRFPLTKSGRKEKKRKKEENREEEDEESYHPVRCQHCSTEVGVYDKDEIYHFFNVMPGY